MTAEIAILNKMAVALAADSAVSIGSPPNLKIYNTVNKIFELSSHAPVGIMVYGRLDFMGIPYEPLIKEYRRILGKKTFAKIDGYRSAFKEHLAKNVPYSEQDARVNVGIIVNEALKEANAQIDTLVWKDIQTRGRYLKSKINSMAQSHLRTLIAELKKKPFAAGFNRKSIPANCASIVDTLVDQAFSSNNPNAGTKSLILEYVGYLLSKRTLSDDRTGIVIAGFGDDDIFPSLTWFETDGMVDGRLKFEDHPTIDIDRSGPDADVLGFAQDDMMKSFLDGVDPAVKRYIEGLIEKSISDTASTVIDALITNSATASAAKLSVKNDLDRIVKDIKDSITDHVKITSANPIRDMIRAMPKQELATLATSLIEITSLKRKVSRERETVGGEVDVAIISKSEGFVWIKRKHYFPSELNRRFAKRQAHLEDTP